jgi:hypothetical protein
LLELSAFFRRHIRGPLNTPPIHPANWPIRK